jgi:hypothetical protein
MRTLKVLLVIASLIFCGFSRDSKTDLKKQPEAGVVKAVKICGQTIDTGGETICTPVQYGISHTQFGLLKGNQSHGGKIIPELSPWEITSCSTDLATKLNISTINGMVTVANGDSYLYDCIMTVNIVDYSVVMDITITGGVGRFEGVSGQVTCKGSISDVVTFCGEGFITFPK